MVNDGRDLLAVKEIEREIDDETEGKPQTRASDACRSRRRKGVGGC